MPRHVGFVGGLVVFVSQSVLAQLSSFPYIERFDGIVTPGLPPGWITSTNRSPSGDFITSTSSPRSSPNTAFSSNSLIPQSLTSPVFDFTNRTPDNLRFYIARSNTHTAPVMVEASTDGGGSFPILLGDTLKNSGTTAYVLTSIQLPSSLAQQPNVRFRWRILGGNGGSNATFRVDDVTLTVLTTYDIGVSSIAAVPSTLTTRDSVVVSVKVKNFGFQTAPSFSLNVFLDSNNNQIADAAEQFSSLWGGALPAGDSAVFAARHSPLKAGDNRIMVTVSFPQDEVGTNDTLSTLISVGYAKRSLLINEIMYAPSGDEPEWVEFFNPGPDTINLKGWRVSDNNVTTKTMISAADVFLPPVEFVVVAKDANFLTIHSFPTYPVVIAGFAALNNTTPDAVVLYDPKTTTIDSVTYSQSWGGQNGTSLERRDAELPAVDVLNWQSSQDSAGSTPGKENSVVRLPYDIAIARVFQTQRALNENIIPVISVVVSNLGKQQVADFSLSCAYKSKESTTPDSVVEVFRRHASEYIAPGDSALFSFEWTTPPAGETKVYLQVEFPPDGRSRNNRDSLVLEFNYESHSLIINEILYEPTVGQNEWLELYNSGSLPVDLLRWKFADRPSTTGTANVLTITGHNAIVKPGEFVVIAAESSIFSSFPTLQTLPASSHVLILNRPSGFSFNNDGDAVILQDITGRTIDSVAYSPSWHNPALPDTRGRSLERINPALETNDFRNWSTSTVFVGGTPGRTNSILTRSLPSSATLNISPNPFSPDGDGYEDFCIVRFNLPSSASFIHVRIYDIKGRLIRTLANLEFVGSHGELVWDGLDDVRRRVRIGPYVVFLEGADAATGAITTAKTVCVVATRL